MKGGEQFSSLTEMKGLGEQFSSLTEIKGGEGQQPRLPDELVERIVAMVPFPAIFKARGLSKSWLARFSSVSELHDEETKRLASSFQKQVAERARNWDTFYFVNFSKTDRCAYNRASRTWHALPAHPLPCEVENIETLHMNGALLLLNCWPDLESDIHRSHRILAHSIHMRPHGLDWYVGNVLTGRWERLAPPVARGQYAVLCETLLSCTSPDAYSIAVFCMSTSGESSVQIYQSKTGAWSIQQLPGRLREDGSSFRSSAYLDGVLYMKDTFERRRLVAYDVEAGSWQDLKLGRNVEDWGNCGDVVVCNSKLMMVLSSPGVSLDGVQMLLVLHIDPVSRQVKEVARSPNLGRFSRRRLVSDGNCIYVGVHALGTDSVNDMKLMVYDVLEDEWSCSDFPRAIGRVKDVFEAFFQPGLCLFQKA